MQISIPSLDVGKSSCIIFGVVDRGSVVVRRAMRRQTFIELFSVATRLPCAASIEEANAASKSLAQEAAMLFQLISRFKVSGSASAASKRPLRAA